MNRLTTLLVFTAIVFTLLACQPVATEQPAPSPTAQPTLSPPPTATFTPTVSPTPIPTANFFLEDIIGTWTREDPDRGILYLIFNADGSYAASHGTPDGIVHSGSYTLDGRVFTFVNGWNCSPLGDTQGQYILTYGGGGQFIYFVTLEDICPDRPSALKSYRWDRVSTAP